jgi:hypothetical protein
VYRFELEEKPAGSGRGRGRGDDGDLGTEAGDEAEEGHRMLEALGLESESEGEGDEAGGCRIVGASLCMRIVSEATGTVDGPCVLTLHHVPSL